MAQTHLSIPDRRFYEQAAKDYCASLPLEHFMESKPTGTQRKITLAAFDQIATVRPDVHCFNELLIQYPTGRDIRDVRRVVPDNLIVVHNGPVHAEGSFNIPFEEAKPFWTLEYASDGNERKDFVDNMRHYEQDLRVPYYLIFEPHNGLMNLFRLTTRKKYASVKPNAADRLEIGELELEVAVLDGWVRFWFRGNLLPTTGELAIRNTEAEAEILRLKAELARLRGAGGG